MHLLKQIPATLALIAINCAVFLWVYGDVGSFDEPMWTLALLDRGALYTPYVFGGEWYRILASMFLHGTFFHLGLNMIALFAIGQSVERAVGTKKLLVVYFLTGIAGALCSMYYNLFKIGVGASGAVFGLFAFELLITIQKYRGDRLRAVPVIVGFLFLLVINFVLGELLNADHFAHFGGAAGGLVIGTVSAILRKPIQSTSSEWITIPGIIILFFFFPKYQVHYFNFFQKVLEAQDSSSYVLSHSGSKSNEQFVKDYRRVNSKWDTAMYMLDAQAGLPEELHSDTFKLRRIIKFHKAEADFRSTMVERESYIYADSIDIMLDSVRQYNSLAFVLNMKYTPPDSTEEKPDPPQLETVRIYYDSNWVEIPYPPAAYFRLGQRDSAGLWQGSLTDFYRNGDVQMKGSYKDDLKDGIFIYYTENKKYSSAGVYNEDQRVGKWETFHPNGRIESEVFYRERYFLKSYWDSAGVQMVKDGNGKEVHKYSNGIVATEGDYVEGYQQGYWYGRHPNGEMYFEENYNHGRLVNGRSRSKTGRTFVYDESTLYALPEGGFRKLNDHISSVTKTSTAHGTVKLSFRVTVSGQLTDFKTEQSVSKELDKRARQIVLSGPRWLPARLHGQEPTDGYGFVSVEF